MKKFTPTLQADADARYVQLLLLTLILFVLGGGAPATSGGYGG